MGIPSLTLEAGKPGPNGEKGGELTFTCGKCGAEFTISKGGIMVPIGTLYCPCGEKWPDPHDIKIVRE